MRISDWSSDVCSSVLPAGTAAASPRSARAGGRTPCCRTRLPPRSRRSSSAVSGDPRFGQRLAGRPDAGDRDRDPRSDGRLAEKPHHRAEAFVEVDEGQRIRRPVPEEVRRSEEHTSELQSLMRISYAVVCLKKKNNKEKN